MSRDNETIVEQAAAWHAASVHDDMDWDGFTAWLEADPRHAAAYDEVALADTLLDTHREILLERTPAAEVPEPSVLEPRRTIRARWAGFAIAASLVGMIAMPQFLAPGAVRYATGADTRTVTLEDGSTVLLAPHSTLAIAGSRQDRLALSGGAWFDIRHDPSRAMSIKAGEVEVSDIGTRFDVQADAGHVRVEVAQGSVAVSSDALAGPVRLIHDQSLHYDSKRGTAEIESLPADSIGEWRQGRLTYDSAPLALVAGDLSRYAGVRVQVPDALSDRRFSGTLVVKDGDAALRDLSLVMGLALVRAGGGYRLGKPAR